MAANMRASGRVRKQPQLYTSSPFTSSSKRKRGAEEDVDGEGDREMPDDDASEESEEDTAEDEPDEEELRAQRKKARKPKSTAPKKPAQKKPRVNGASLPFRNASATTRKRAPKKTKAVDVADAQAAGGLFAEVFASGDTLQDVAGTWLKRYDAHQSSALAEIVNFVLKCADSNGEVSDHDIEDPDGVTNKLDDLREEYQASKPTDYPLIAKGKAATSFRHGIAGFFHALIQAMAVKGVLYTDPVLMENVQIWISTMSSAPNRSFRHTATVASLAIVTALCQVARENAESIANFQRQAETERKKASANTARVKQIEQNAREKSEALEIIEPLLKDWFDVVFIHRYRDVDPVIRRDCIIALGDWIVTMPDVFFDGQHLRYLGWLLSDCAPATRGEVLKQLHRLYKEQDMLGGLKTFTEKFRARMVEIATTDAETNVRVSGIELLDLLRENGLLEPDDIDAAGRLIFDTDPKVRKAVAAFFAENINDLHNSKIDDLGGLENLEEALPETGEGNYEAPRIEWLGFKSLAELLQSYDMDEDLPSQVERSRADGSLTLHLGDGNSRFSLAADALYDKVDDIKAWQMLAGYLLFDHSSGCSNGMADDPLSQLKHESTLSEKEETVLLEVLNASVKRTLVETAEKITAPKSKLTKKAKEQLEDEQEEAARHLVELIPKLLNKFGDVPCTVAAVLRMEALLSSPALKDLQQDSATYAALLDDVRKQFMSHSTDEVLAPASDAILHAKSYGELGEAAEEKVTALWEDVINNLAELLNPATIGVRGATSFEELTALSNNLLRIVRLSTVSDCIAPLEDGSVASSDGASGNDYQGAIDYIIALVQRASPSTGPAPDSDEAALEDEVAARAAEAAFFYCRWKLMTIITVVTTGSNTGVSIEELEALATRRDLYVTNLENALQARKAGEAISVHLTGCLLDLYAAAAILKDVPARPGVSDDYTVLAMNLTPELQKTILQVFIAAEKNFAKLSGKKLEGAPANDADVDQDGMDEDPMSDPESGDEDDDEPTQALASQQRRDTKIRDTILAEQTLCALTGKIIHALAADVMDNAAVRKRLERNKARLGHNFKEVLAYLDIGEVQKKKTKAKGKTKKDAVNGAKGKAKPNPKSNAIIADDEIEDEIEDADAEDEEAQRARG
ncbi:hypothetical protein LTR36_002068 [Oleoguttula mirabilis]|uniref:SCD domain-containing protein n=1 Tax=Oleoguttula mirabilis TaxID=1507867 RepID=A0AAV9JLL6_9PEZI|nr:hypothetical protein LTR36_002068 [Oleoguttula mirabilis]